MIPTRSSNPTVYLPKFSPLWVPDKALKPITSAFNFHFASFTSIQCAVMPRNPVFVVSADHPSAVTDTFPGAAYVSSKYFQFLRDSNSLTIIASSTLPICFTNLLWSWTFTSYELGRSAVVDFGLIETRALPRGFQKFNRIPGVEFFISLGFAEPTTHVI